MRATLCWRFLAWPLLTACTASVPSPAVAPPPATRSLSEPSALSDTDWVVLRSPSLGLKLALPEGRAWRTQNSPSAAGAGWSLLHGPTGSSLRVRRWRASRLPRIDACEAELRAREPDLAGVDDTNLVSRREVRSPEGFVTRISLVALPGRDARLRGQALAVGAGVGECISAIARTDCETEDELAERLRLLDAALGHLRLMRIEDRVPTPQLISPR